MDDRDIGRIWAEYYPKADSRDALQICECLCRLIRDKTRFVLSLRRGDRLQRVLDACEISKAEFDEVEKSATEGLISPNPPCILILAFQQSWFVLNRRRPIFRR
jgi:hypothetical protein